MENTRGTKKKMLLTRPQGGQGVFTEGQSGAFPGEERCQVDSRLTPLQAEGRADAKAWRSTREWRV